MATVRLTRGQAKSLGLVPKKARARLPRKLPAGWCITLTLPVCVVSEMNRRDYWTVRRERFAVQADTLAGVLLEAGLMKWSRPGRVEVVLTHVGSVMDDDNLRSAFKGLRDALAARLDVDDGDTELVIWTYTQELPAPGGAPGVRVAVRGR